MRDKFESLLIADLLHRKLDCDESEIPKMSRLALFVLIIGIVHRANGDTCTWTWVTPAAGTTTLTKSVNAPATFSASVTGTTLESNDVIKLKSGSDVLLTGTATVSGSDVTWAKTDDNAGATLTDSGALDGKTYTFTIPENQLEATDSGAIVIENGACVTSGLTTSTITLTVQSCDLKAYGNLATADNQDPCNYNCEKEFTCGTDSTTKFTAKCQADATWSVPYACDVCPGATSAGVKEVAILALVMLCSALSATHLM